ncbi:MAG: SDR family oxidoreductase [Elusimicrobia bacterium]|nr:SDR family oxidoreductase [Elusimicrobiota bacterium]
MAQWLVTGGAGFIGSHIAETLVSKGERVRVLDDFSTGKREYLLPLLKKIDLLEGDIRDKKIVQKAMRGTDYVLHQAALRSVPRSIEQPEECNSINITGILNCLMAARKAKVKRFVFASSSSIYGDSNLFPQKESDLPSPLSPYAVSKACGEHYCRVFSKTYGLSTVSLRYFNVFGPRQDPKSKYAAVIPKFILAALKGIPLEVHWDGKQARDFTYLSDVAQANIAAATSSRLKCEAYNVAYGNCISLLEIIQMIEKMTGKSLKKVFYPKREGDVRKTYADTAAIQRDLKFKPQFTFEQGLKSTFDYFAHDGVWKRV